MLIKEIISIIIILANFILGLWVLLNNPRKKANQSVFAIATSCTIWVFTNLMVDIARTNTAALNWSKATLFGPLFIPVFFLYFSYVFPRYVKLDWKKLLLLFSPSVLFLIFLPTKYNIQEAQIVVKNVPRVIPGILYIYFFIYFLIYCGVAIYHFFKNAKKCSLVERTQIKYIIWGSVTSLSLGIFANAVLLLMGISQASSLGPFVTIIWVTALAIAILRHHLFNIKAVLTEILVFVIGTILLIQVFIAGTLTRQVINGGIFLFYSLIGYLLTRSVLQEIKLREQLAVANKELKRLDETKTEFLSIASHQLRTPLTAIKGYLGMIKEGIYGEVSEEIKSTLHKVYDSNERLIKLVNSLLDISRLEMGRMEFIFKKVNIEEMIESIVDEFHIAAKKKNLSLVFERSKSPLPEIFIDAEKIRQVIFNLIDNAIKYTYRGVITIKCKVIDQGKERIRISVTDIGIGIARKEIKEIFKIYRRGTGTRLFPEGSGVGLYVVRKLVEAHGGKIWVKSEGKGKGSTFYVELPLKQQKEDTIEEILRKF